MTASKYATSVSSTRSGHARIRCSGGVGTRCSRVNPHATSTASCERKVFLPSTLKLSECAANATRTAMKTTSSVIRSLHWFPAGNLPRRGSLQVSHSIRDHYDGIEERAKNEDQYDQQQCFHDPLPSYVQTTREHIYRFHDSA
jgi:hypothetical protein